MKFDKKFAYSLNEKGELYKAYELYTNYSHLRCYYKYQTLVLEGEVLYLHLLYERGYCNLKDLELIYSEDITVRQMLFQYLKDKYERIKKFRKEKRSIKKS